MIITFASIFEDSFETEHHQKASDNFFFFFFFSASLPFPTRRKAFRLGQFLVRSPYYDPPAPKSYASSTQPDHFHFADEAHTDTIQPDNHFHVHFRLTDAAQRTEYEFNLSTAPPHGDEDSCPAFLPSAFAPPLKFILHTPMMWSRRMIYESTYTK